MAVLRICAKCSDLFTAEIVNGGETIKTHDGSVIESMPGEHYGDYVEMDISIATGKILNWKFPSVAKLKKEMNGK